MYLSLSPVRRCLKHTTTGVKDSHARNAGRDTQTASMMRSGSLRPYVGAALEGNIPIIPLHYLVGIIVVGGYLTLWVIWKVLYCAYHSWRHKD